LIGLVDGGSGINYAARGQASGSGTNYGFRGDAFGPTGSTGISYGVYGCAGGSHTNYGVYAIAGGDGTCYGIYAEAGGSGDNYAGYFNGDVQIIGNLGIGNAQPTQKLDVTGTAQMTGFKLPTNAVDGYVLTSDANGVGTWKAPPDRIKGGGTKNYLPKFTEATSIGNSTIYEDDNGDISIGTTQTNSALIIHPGQNETALYIEHFDKTTNGNIEGLQSLVRTYQTGYSSAIAITGSVSKENGEAVAIGVKGQAYGSSPGNKYGIYGTTFGSGTRYAGYFYGNVQVTGTLTKGGGAFKIDHPLDPDNKYLYHSFVESPDMKNIYDGTVVLDQTGEATIILPDWFEALNKDFRYQLTCIGGYAPVFISEEIAHNQFKIAGGKPGMKVSWQVTGTRHDAFAEKHRIPVEETKPDRERGKYLHPEAFGVSETLGVDYENIKRDEK